MSLNELGELCGLNGLVLDGPKLHLLERYAALLIDWNSKINLISRKDEQNVLERHLLHSLTLRMPKLCSYDFTGKRIVDVGTGGGLPGIPLRIATTDLQVTLLDSIQKKIVADNDIVERLGLKDVSAVCGRAEELATDVRHARKYQAVVSRAVAQLDELVGWSRGLIAPGGMLFSLKGGDLTEEINRTERLSYVKRVEVTGLALSGYDGFFREDKKLVSVELT
jgi:16S rRNA (guanine527-N7)-methyltransferase